jgi:hypothetical protein
MTTDADGKDPGPRPVDLWRLPRILAVEVARVRYRPPRPHVVAGRSVAMREAVEVTVRTAAPFPVRALAPVLYVGDVALTESETIDEKLTRFFAFEPRKLRRGAPIALGWVNAPGREPTRFRFGMRPAPRDVPRKRPKRKT